jgi:hypothetical protein
MVEVKHPKFGPDGAIPALHSVNFPEDGPADPDLFLEQMCDGIGQARAAAHLGYRLSTDKQSEVNMLVSAQDVEHAFQAAKALNSNSRRTNKVAIVIINRLVCIQLSYPALKY